MLCNRNKIQIPRVVQRFSRTLQQFMHVITVNKQNRNQKIFSLLYYKNNYCLNKLKQTAQALLSQPNDIIIYLRIILLFCIPITGWLLACLVKTARVASGNDHPAWFCELLHPEDWGGNFSNFCSDFKSKSVLLMKAGSVPNSSTITKYLAQWIQKVKSKSFYFTITVFSLS